MCLDVSMVYSGKVENFGVKLKCLSDGISEELNFEAPTCKFVGCLAKRLLCVATVWFV